VCAFVRLHSSVARGLVSSVARGLNSIPSIRHELEEPVGKNVEEQFHLKYNVYAYAYIIHTDIQTDIHTDRHTDIHACKHIHVCIYCAKMLRTSSI
jgi:hypothetical protein